MVSTFGNGKPLLPEPDIVYRVVPVYNASVSRQIIEAVKIKAALRSEKTAIDIGAGVPKEPAVLCPVANK